MPLISIRNLNELANIAAVKRLMQALPMLDAILSPEWDTRYYSFNARWGDEAMMASMRNGQGDQWFAVFSPAGAALHGLALEAPTVDLGPGSVMHP